MSTDINLDKIKLLLSKYGKTIEGPAQMIYDKNDITVYQIKQNTQCLILLFVQNSKLERMLWYDDLPEDLSNIVEKSVETCREKMSLKRRSLIPPYKKVNLIKFFDEFS